MMGTVDRCRASFLGGFAIRLDGVVRGSAFQIASGDGMEFVLTRIEAKQVYTLAEECCGMWDDPTAWQCHAAAHVETLTDGLRVSLMLSDLSIDAYSIIELQGCCSFSENEALLQALQAAPTDFLPGRMQGLRTVRTGSLGTICLSRLTDVI
jgi:hypothetical protein